MASSHRRLPITDDISIRWLGVAGVELAARGYVLAIDPFFTRPPFRRLWFGRVAPDHALVAAKLPRCDAILVSHSHYDHLLDVPAVASHTGATVYGSPNTCRLAAALGVPAGQVRQIGLGDRLALGPFEVAMLPAEHIKTPLDYVLRAPLPAVLRPPLRLTDYRMDAYFSFSIHVGPYRILHGEAPTPADLWLSAPVRPGADNAEWVRVIQPRIVMPIHWDDFFRPLSQPIRPSFALPRFGWPPVSRLDPAATARAATRRVAGARVLVPEIFRPYPLAELLPDASRGLAYFADAS